MEHHGSELWHGLVSEVRLYGIRYKVKLLWTTRVARNGTIAKTDALVGEVSIRGLAN